MTGAGMQKHFHDVNRLHAHRFFSQTGLIADLGAGQVFPAIRKNEVHFYYGGARLCVYKERDGQMHTNNRYLGIREGKSRDVLIKKEWSTQAKYNEIKDTCKNHRSPDSELRIVSELFPEFSIAALSDLTADRTRLLDIECRFPGVEKPADLASKAQEMIDCLFLTSKGTSVFVEVKRTTNKAARSSGQRAGVIDQLKGYRKQLQAEEKRNEIKDVYTRVINTLGQILKRKDLQSPKTVFKSVPLLIVGPAASSPHSKEVWQRDLLAAPLSLDSDIIGIDGRDERVVAPLDQFFGAVDGKFAEAARQ
jgi:hypothetical protein